MRRLALVLAVLVGAVARAEDWPTFGRDRTHNAVSPEKNPPTDWQIELRDAKTKAVTRPARNVAWTADVGWHSHGGPVVADGLVWVGTNNRGKRDPAFVKDAAVLMCFRERDGAFLWQYVSPRLRNMVQDGPYHAMGSTPLIEGDRLWIVTNRCEALCLDIGPLERGTGVPKEVWRVDLIATFGVVPNAPIMAMGFTASPTTDEERLFVVTGNGVSEDRKTVPAPKAPGLVCLDKTTGRTLWTDNSSGKDILLAERSSPLVIEVKGRTQVVVGQGDGWLRAFDSRTGAPIWKCDLNPKAGNDDGYGRISRNYPMATPAYHAGRVYIAPGQDPEHYEGVGHLYCIDPTREGDVSLELPDGPGKGKPNPNSAVVWRYGGPAPKEDDRYYLFGRTQSNCTVADGLAYICDIAGYLYCFDATAGRLHWRHDLRASTWGTPLWVDGKVYVGTEDGDVWIFAHGPEKPRPTKIEMEIPIRNPLVYANGTLYVLSERRLFAIRQSK